MGRVARYKKVKSFDPYSRESRKNGRKGHDNFSAQDSYVWGSSADRKKKKRSAKATALRKQKLSRRRNDNQKDLEGFDLACGKDEFDLRDLMGSVKKETTMTKASIDNLIGASNIKNKRDNASCLGVPETMNMPSQQKVDNNDENEGTSSGGKTQPTISQIGKEEKDHKELVRFLKVDKKDDNASSSFQKRQEGESIRAFEKRLKEETRILIDKSAHQAIVSNPARKERTKQYLLQKKLRKKNKNNSNNNSYYDSDDDEYNTNSKLSSKDDGFVTGEQAIARLSFLNQVEQPPTFTQLPRGAQHKKLQFQSKKPKINIMNPNEIKAEQRAMEQMRLKVQSQYALIKAKRKKEGDFHL